MELGLKRAAFYLVQNGAMTGKAVFEYTRRMAHESDPAIAALGASLIEHNRRGSLVFMSAEAEPFSKSGGLANVVYELPRELVRLGETVYVISGYYRHGDEKSMRKMRGRGEEVRARLSPGTNVRFKIMGDEYEVGVHHARGRGRPLLSSRPP